MMLCATGVSSADTEAEQMAKTLCAGCHGPTGISTNPLWPNLAGQHAAYTAKQLRDFRDGAREDPNMSGLSQTLTDRQIEALAAYYAELPEQG
jgi:cytochrome c553